MSLYNAVNGAAYTDAGDIMLTTIEDAVCMNMKTAEAHMSVAEFKGKLSPSAV